MTVERLEAGTIYFFYRPRVVDEHVGSLDDVRRLQIVLHPWAGQSLRLLVLGNKRLPDSTAQERAWCFVDRVAPGPEDLDESLGERTYRTRTRGLRVQPAARPVGEGAYLIGRHGDHTHLAFELEAPRRPGAAQRELGIAAEAGYLVAVRNPAAPPSPEEGRRRPHGPLAVGVPAAHFGDRRFIPLDPPELLDHRGIDLVLLSAGPQAARELGLRPEPGAESVAHRTLIEDLRIGRRHRLLEPLSAGE
ncbi:hypothetical protein GCM10020358_22270 [Amorphoplanes nipponensis]|uniref:Uncharacterized protein n=1 Tax=Actinoplanes nipponensis TaxID=135950 RepID=A0A919JJI8_9ACTN|nr:hypothetical protein [Actinoplanes nipponensis]GIE47934.1 hypothetical protein Ani05nite_14680 [Actinoplanes nipponensis]